MKSFIGQDYEQLIKMLVNIEELVDQFYKLTCKQTEILQSNDVELLGENINDRQKIIERIDGIQIKVNGLLKGYENLEFDSTSDASKIDQVLLIRERIKEKLRKTQVVNENNEKKANEIRGTMRSEGNRIQMNQKSVRLYNQDMMLSEPIYYDKRN